MNKSCEELQKELDEATAKLEQYQYQQQRLESRLNELKELLRFVGLYREAPFPCW